MFICSSLPWAQTLPSLSFWFGGLLRRLERVTWMVQLLTVCKVVQTQCYFAVPHICTNSEDIWTRTWHHWIIPQAARVQAPAREQLPISRPKHSYLPGDIDPALARAEVSEQKAETFWFYCRRRVQAICLWGGLLGRNTKSESVSEPAQATRRQLAFFYLFKVFYLFFWLFRNVLGNLGK